MPQPFGGKGCRIGRKRHFFVFLVGALRMLMWDVTKCAEIVVQTQKYKCAFFFEHLSNGPSTVAPFIGVQSPARWKPGIWEDRPSPKIQKRLKRQGYTVANFGRDRQRCRLGLCCFCWAPSLILSLMLTFLFVQMALHLTCLFCRTSKNHGLVYSS